jgi:hypothetical protein
LPWRDSPPARRRRRPGCLPNVDVSVLQANDAEDAVAVNPTNPSNVVAMAITFTQPAGLIEGVSFNGGKTWTRQIIGGSTSDPLGDICCDEQLAWDRYGNLWMTYLLNSTGDVLVAVSTDGGLTWTKAADVVPITKTGDSQPKGKPRGQVHLAKYGDQPSIAVGSNSVWVSYTSIPSGEVQAFGAPVSGPGIYGAFFGPAGFGAPRPVDRQRRAVLVRREERSRRRLVGRHGRRPERRRADLGHVLDGRRGDLRAELPH